ncbi:MAG: phosphatidate cytidylyltransferase [Lachnospiraceae bacterium]|nr:phosphatidate cytidylyltransferase [Lachnospiraceae bacterium]
MFWKRVASGVVLISVLGAGFYFGGILLLVIMWLLSLIGQFELYRAVKIEKSLFAYSGYFITTGYYINLYMDIIKDPLIFIILTVLVFMFIYVFKYYKYDITLAGLAFLGVYYVPVMLSFIYRVRMHGYHGFFFVWLIMIASWGADTCAYIIGMLFGKHKLAPVLSPKKSIEGAIGGVVGASLIALLDAFLMTRYSDISDYELLISVIVTICGALMSIFGDLAASAIKRNHDVKDFGNLIPGHGGVLDRFDSVIFTAPLVYVLVFYLT